MILRIFTVFVLLAETLHSQSIKIMVKNVQHVKEVLSLSLSIENKLSKKVFVSLPYEVTIPRDGVSGIFSAYVMKADTLFYQATDNDLKIIFSSYVVDSIDSVSIKLDAYFSKELKIAKESSADFLVAFSNVEVMPKYVVLPALIHRKQNGKKESIRFVINLPNTE